MTKKDFIKLAELIHKYNPSEDFVEEVADFCQGRNTRFNREKFLEACNGDSDETDT